MHKTIKKTAVILSLLLTSVSIEAMDPPKVELLSNSSINLKNTPNFSLLEGQNPFKLFQDIICLTEAKRDYHEDMAKLCSKIDELTDDKKGKYLLQMYGMEWFTPLHIDLCFKTAVEDHTAWAKQCDYLLHLLNFGEDIFSGNPDAFVEKIEKLKTHFENGINFYESGKRKSQATVFSASKSIEGGRVRYEKMPGSGFTIKHTINEYTDFISSYGAFSKKLQYQRVLFNLVRKSKDISTERCTINKNQIGFKVKLADVSLTLDLLDYLSIASIFDPSVMQKYENERNLYGTLDLSIVDNSIKKILPSNLINQNLAEKPIEPTTIDSQEVLISNDVEDSSNPQIPVTAAIAPFSNNIKPQVREPIVLPQKKLKSERRAESRKRAKEKKRGAPANPVKTQVAPLIPLIPAYNVYTSPLGELYGTSQLDTLDNILNCRKNIKWADFEALVTSPNGLNGKVLKNKGGSARTICFNHPVTGKQVIFTIHKPHKSGKGAAVLYLALTTRIKTKLTEAGLFA